MSERLSLHLTLTRPFVDLSETAAASVQTSGIEAAFRHVLEDPGYSLPIQYHPAAGLRDRILRELGAREFSCAQPSEVAPELRTARWSRLVEWTDGFEDLPETRQKSVISLCQTLGLYTAVTALAARALNSAARAADPLATDFGAWMLTRVLRARSLVLRSRTAHQADIANLADIALADHLQLEQRISAGLSLVVQHSKGEYQDPALAARWRAHTERLFSGFRPEEHWTSLGLASSYWRGICFVPFQRGLREQVTEELERAERYAVAMPSGSVGEDTMRRQYLHPLLETRIREANWLGDLDLSVARAERLIELDPLEPKVYITAGDVHLRAGDRGRAVERYRQAAVLGPPYTVLSRYKLGCALEAAGDLDGALSEFVAALRAEPGAVTCARAAQRLARLRDDASSASWAGRLASTGGSGR
ncbi:hypothetical protein [Actinomadura sp. DC4]|uniref:hypothetical protein n=1 Tax=Actinomadura sp. DC4 TaxID=3055069 RepID=UPI0025AF966F|nr:hypothetical protein [Actinomadura sp. DC4]MDN3354462.1 hypothetical protein [Actinomadura sp. DC4]